jgi:hypothetical protein
MPFNASYTRFIFGKFFICTINWYVFYMHSYVDKKIYSWKSGCYRLRPICCTGLWSVEASAPILGSVAQQQPLSSRTPKASIMGPVLVIRSENHKLRRFIHESMYAEFNCAWWHWGVFGARPSACVFLNSIGPILHSREGGFLVLNWWLYQAGDMHMACMER